MKDNGLRLLLVGYETGSQQILNNIRKGTRIDVARRFTEDCHRLGITIHGTFIVGLPGETPRDDRETIRFASEINPHTIQVSLAAPYPGTELYQQAADERLARVARTALVGDNGVQIGAISYPNLSTRGDLEALEDVLQALLFPPAEDRGDGLGDDPERRDDEAAASRGRRVLPVPLGSREGAGVRTARRHGRRLRVLDGRSTGRSSRRTTRRPDPGEPDGGGRAAGEAVGSRARPPGARRRAPPRRRRRAGGPSARDPCSSITESGRFRGGPVAPGSGTSFPPRREASWPARCGSSSSCSGKRAAAFPRGRAPSHAPSSGRARHARGSRC